MADLIADAPVEVAAAAFMAGARCPKCGKNKGALGRGYVPTPERSVCNGTDDERRSAWLRLNDSGLSSRCIADRMCGSRITGDHPHDADDFGRCERLLALYPQWRARLEEMTPVSAYWGALVPRWNEIAEAWRHDDQLYRSGARRGPWLCSKLMRSILDPVEAADPHVVRIGRDITVRFGA